MSPSGNNAPCSYMEVSFSLSTSSKTNLKTNKLLFHNHIIKQGWWWVVFILILIFSIFIIINYSTFRWESQPWQTACGPLSLAKQTLCWAFANMIHENIHLQCSIKLLLLLWVHETLVEYVGIYLCHSQTNLFNSLFIGPESDHWQPLSLTDSLTTKG